MNTNEYRKMIDDFEHHYHYDSTYMRELLEASKAGFEKFNDFLPLARHQERLSSEDYWVAKLAAMQIENCGECLQLNVRMALESGVAKEIIKAALNDCDALSVELKDIYTYARLIAANESIEPELMARMNNRYDKGDLLEFGLGIATGMVFPVLRRAAGYSIKNCRLMEIEV